jgi:hypothetical protein
VTSSKVIDIPVAPEQANGVDQAPLPEAVAPSPAAQWGINIATVLSGIVAGLPPELAPSSRYHLALQLTQTLLQTQAASALVPQPSGRA